MSGPFFSGMIAGFGERAAERNTLLMNQEIDRRKGLVALYTTLYNAPNMPPEMRQKFLEFIVEIPQLPFDKKLPPKYTDLAKLLQERQQLPGPMLPPSTAVPDGIPPLAEPTPEPDLIGAAAPPAPPEAVAPAAPGAPTAAPLPPVPVEAPVPPTGVTPAPAPVAPEAPAARAIVPPAEAPAAVVGAPTPAGEAAPALATVAAATPPAAAAPGIPPPPDVFAPLPHEMGPPPTFEETPRAQAILNRIASGRATATEINEAQQWLRAGLPPPDITMPRPVPVTAGGALAEVDPLGRLTGEMLAGPPAVGTVPGVGTFDAYVENAFQTAREQKRAQGLPPILSAEERNDIIEQSQETYPRSRAGQWIPLYDENSNVQFGAVNYEQQAFRPIPLGTAGDFAGAGQITDRPLSDTARKDKAALEVMLQDTQRLDVLANMNRDKIGPGWGRYYGVARRFYDIGESANRMFRIAQNLRDLLVRARSGAQVNERELEEMEKIMPNPSGTESAFFANLREFQLEGMRIFRNRFKVEYKPLLIQDDGSVWEQQPGGKIVQIDQLY